jgi:hypothetical protein
VPIDPVRWRHPLPDATDIEKYHGQPVFSAAGAGVWLAIAVLYIILIALLFRRTTATFSRTTTLGLCATIVIVAIVHPMLVPVLLPSTWREPYGRLFEFIHAPVYAGRMGLNVPMLLTVVSLLHALLVYGLIVRVRKAPAGSLLAQ